MIRIIAFRLRHNVEQNYYILPADLGIMLNSIITYFYRFRHTVEQNYYTLPAGLGMMLNRIITVLPANLGMMLNTISYRNAGWWWTELVAGVWGKIMNRKQHSLGKNKQKKTLQNNAIPQRKLWDQCRIFKNTNLILSQSMSI